MKPSIEAIELNIQVNANLINRLNLAIPKATATELEQLMLLVKMRRVATSEWMLDKCKEYDNRIWHKCNSILSA